MQRKVEHTATSKKITDIQADTLQIKKWENGLLLLDSQGEEKKWYIYCSDVKLCIRQS